MVRGFLRTEVVKDALAAAAYVPGFFAAVEAAPAKLIHRRASNGQGGGA